MGGRYALLVAVILALLAAVGMNKLISKMEKDVRSQVDPIRVIAARVDIPSGETIREDMIERVDFPGGYFRAGMFQEGEESRVLGFEATRSIQAGKPIFSIDLEVAETRPRRLLRSGRRLFTVQVGPQSGVGGLLRPGDRVDVIGVAREDGDAGGKLARTLLWNLEVFDIGQMQGYRGHAGGELPYRTVTLDVSPLEAEVLAYATRDEVVLVKRSANDPASPFDIPAENARVGPEGVGSANLEEVLRRLRGR